MKERDQQHDSGLSSIRARKVPERDAEDRNLMAPCQPAMEMLAEPYRRVSAQKHADAVSRSLAGGVSRTENLLLAMQRLHGNRHVQRVLALARQGDGTAEVAPEVEHAINQARGGGQALDSQAREQMEPAFGTDFSDVRVHTGSEADTLNRAVSARAFTTGRDIFFRDGEYNPGSSDGRELLAHELTHVVQQRGSTVQAKLEVSEPGDACEQEADRMAKEITRSAPSGIDSGCGASSKADTIRLQRRVDKRQVKWWGSAPRFTSDSEVWFNPSAQLWFGNKMVQSSDFPVGRSVMFGTVSPGQSGVVRLSIEMGWFQDNLLFNYSGTAQSITEIPFTVTAAGEVQWQEAIQSNETSGDAAELIVPVSVAKGSMPAGGYVTVSPTIRSAGSTTAGSTSSVSVEGIGGGASSSETTSRVAAWQAPFTVYLVAPKPSPILITHLADVHFAAGSDRIEEAGEVHVVSFYRGLPSDVRKAVEQGATEIVLRGHASTTAGFAFNRDLSRRRSLRVKQILQDIAGADARINVSGVGKYEARTADNVEDISERRVDIEVTAPKLLSP
jgi:outer membrane protein OmpA-like peptidoglycan-associated protein